MRPSSRSRLPRLFPAGRVGRVGLRRPPVAHARLLVPALRALGVAEPDPRGRRLRLKVDGEPVGLLGFLGGPPAFQHHREGEAGLECPRVDRARAPEAGLRVGRPAELRECLARAGLDLGIAGTELGRFLDEPNAGSGLAHVDEGEAGVQAGFGKLGTFAHGRARRIEGVPRPVLGQRPHRLREAASDPFVRLPAHAPPSPEGSRLGPPPKPQPGPQPGSRAGSARRDPGETAPPARGRRPEAVSPPPPEARSRPPGREGGRTHARSHRSAGGPRLPTGRRTARRCSGPTPATPRRRGGSPSPT